MRHRRARALAVRDEAGACCGHDGEHDRDAGCTGELLDGVGDGAAAVVGAWPAGLVGTTIAVPGRRATVSRQL